MKCTRCKKEALVKLKRHNAKFCGDCFEVFFSRQVESAIKRKNMFSEEEKVLVGVSGGKDSMSLWHYLKKAGYEVVAIHFDLGIEEHSQNSRQIVEEFARQNSFPLEIIEVKKEVGFSIPEIKKRIPYRPICSMCGLIKRYLLNFWAFREHFSVYATGHNLDDEAATLLGNVLHWQIDYLSHQHPTLPSPHPKMVKKVKPFYTLTEEEIMIYIRLHNIPFLEERCPLSRRAKSWDYKEALNFLEEKSPGTKHMFWLGFLETGQKYFRQEEPPLHLGECSICGMPTTQEVCSFCRLIQKVKEREEKYLDYNGGK